MWLGIANSEDQFTGENLGKVKRFHLIGSVRHHRWTDGIDRHEGEWGPGSTSLIKENKLVGRWSTLTTKLLWPPNTEPAVFSHAHDDVSPHFSAFTRRCESVPNLRGQDLFVVRAQFVAKCHLLSCLFKEH